MKYILLTSAYNEEKNIQKTIESVVNQTIRPKEWIIISDGSTDATDSIICEYSEKYSFIKYFRNEKKETHCFGAKIRALNLGLTKISAASWDYLGIIDADISFQSDYFEILKNEFLKDKKLGICGGDITELVEDKEFFRIKSLDTSVAGAVQFFRRECWEQIGGFSLFKYGGEDSALEITARSNGWYVRTIALIKVKHYGYVGQGSGSKLKAKWKEGISYYHLGYHPLFEIARCLRRLREYPMVLGSITEFFGFLSSYFSKEKCLLPEKTVKYLRKEQIKRLFGRTI